MIALNEIIKIHVTVNQKEFQVLSFDPWRKSLKVQVKSKPENNQANNEIEKQLTRILKKKVKIVKGLKSKNKIIEVQDSDPEQLKKILGI